MYPNTKRHLRSAIADTAAFKEVRDILTWVDGVGTRYFVHSGTGLSTNSGRDPDEALATIDQAYNKATASKGDRIYVMPGHAETISAAGTVTLDKIGVAVIGLGWGAMKPTLTFSATASTVLVSSASNIFNNFRLVSDVNDLVTFLDLDAGQFLCEDCDFVTSSAKEAICFVDIATTFDEFTFRRCKFFQPTDPAGVDDDPSTGCFYFVDSEGIYIEDCIFYGNFETAIFHNKTTAAKNVWVKNCYGTQLLSTALVYTQVALMEGGQINSTWNVRLAADVTEATWTGTVSANFVFDVNSGVLADGLAGGQYAAPGTAANS